LTRRAFIAAAWVSPLQCDSTLDVVLRLDKFGFVSNTSSQPFLNDQIVAV
jgi:hypothetical protein